MAFRYTEQNREEYITDGFTILRDLIPASLLADLRRETDRAREIARTKHGPQAQRLQPVYAYEELNAQTFRDFLGLEGMRATVEGILGPEHRQTDIMGVLLEPAEKATVRVESMLDRDSETREVIDTAISEAGDLPPKVRVRLVGALRGLAKRATRLADRLEGVEQAEARTHNAGNAGNGVDAAESAAARKIANADDELGPAR
jgi:hypothetical protein